MKEELTREVVEALAKYSGAEYSKCENCPAAKICDSTDETSCKWLASALFEEMDKPKVWDGAPEDAKTAQVMWFDKNDGFASIRTFTRELPKTLTQKIADEIVDAINIKPHRSPIVEPMVETVVKVLEKYAAELKGDA